MIYPEILSGAIANNVSWILVGYDAELEYIRFRDTARLAEAVQRRKNSMTDDTKPTRAVG